MAQDAAHKPKFPAPIPNPLTNPLDEDEKTDPALALPRKLATPAPNSPAPPAAATTPAPKLPNLGLLDALIKDPSISEIMVNDLRNVMIERDGKLTTSGFAYSTIDELNRLVRTLLEFSGRALTPEQPYVDFMLPDGSRVNIVGPPVTLGAPSLTIRKFPTNRLSADELINKETLDRRMAHFLTACVVGRLNILVSGGTGSGKTTLLNILTSFVPKAERVITIEDTAELAIAHANSVRMQTKPPTPTSPGISTHDLVTNALRMRPDRIIVGEVRSGEALDMLQGMNTGHDGSMATIHANSPRDALTRLETLSLMSSLELPLIAIRKQIANAVDVVIQIKRLRNGKRKVVAISEVTGIEGDTVTLQEIFSWPGTDETRFKCTGFVPTFVERLRENGIEFPPGFFG